jgi:hypothetical protein
MFMLVAVAADGTPQGISHRAARAVAVMEVMDQTNHLMLMAWQIQVAVVVAAPP